MDFSTDIENRKIHLYCWENERKVSDYVLEFEEVQNLVHALSLVLFDNILEQNKDVLIRLKDNEPAPKWIKADDVEEWLKDQACCGWIEDIEIEKFVNKFKKDFGL